MHLPDPNSVLFQHHGCAIEAHSLTALPYPIPVEIQEHIAVHLLRPRCACRGAWGVLVAVGVLVSGGVYRHRRRVAGRDLVARTGIVHGPGAGVDRGGVDHRGDAQAGLDRVDTAAGCKARS